MNEMPTTLMEALEVMKKHSDPDFIELLRSQPENSEDDFGGMFHMRQGMRIRNDWGLWYNETPISRWFIERGIQHADDKSGILMTSFYRWIRGSDIRLDEQIKFYRDYWCGIGMDPDNLVDYDKMSKSDV